MEIKFDKQQLRDIESAMQSIGKSPKPIMKQAINRTLTGVRTDATQEISAVITPAKKIIRATFTNYNATITKLSGKSESKGGPLPLINYSARPVKKGVTVQVIRGSRRALLEHYFIATMKSGHKSVFYRELPPGIERRPVDKKRKYGRFLPSKYRFPIHKAFGPAVQDIYGRPKVLNAVLEKGNKRLETNLTDLLNFQLSKAA
jgi:hypothetical protein